MESLRTDSLDAVAPPAVVQVHMEAAVVPAMSIRHLRGLEWVVRDRVGTIDPTKVKVMKELVVAVAVVMLQAVVAEAEVEIATAMQGQEARLAAIQAGAMAAMRVCGLR